MAEDGFPSEAFATLLRRLPRYARLAWALGRDPAVGRARRAAVIAGAGYLLSPIDLVPGIIPVLGQLDDLIVILTALRLALDGLQADRRQAHLAAVGLADDDLATDLRTTGAVGAWVVRRAARVGARVGLASARLLGRSAVRLGRGAGQAGRGVGRSIARRREPGPDSVA
jgi:uncharacterized membrane protein YkvA (DUF1232 family)